jgi:hypothetical protein
MKWNVRSSMSVRRSALLVLAVTLLSPVIVASVATPAGACSCVQRTDGEALAQSDAVFTGRLVDVRRPPEVHSSLDPATWVFSVDRVYKGAVTKRQEIVTALESASCGLETTGPRRLLVFAVGRRKSGVGPAPARGQYAANSCGGTRALADQPVPPGFGHGHVPKKR